MKFKGPKLLKYVLIATMYPTLYLSWVKLMKDTWVNK